ncbi:MULTISPECIES: MFS transporter [unclassified Microbacterium]|uniref:MFS transporter n=1 Tax=unclassified Microbacterium TaxID=2609290 RepID=UPI00214B70BD|nr:MULTISPECIES: MFS transporter [unclassified Microbacterium]MCR2783542.1 MFS transporter [Microbacterium sp. zg.B96]WIM15597.1 MFS transporter [Microbacterium sp. zg-B96]
MSRAEVALLLAGTLGAALAYLVPMVFTLALQLDLLEPGNEAVLGYIIGAGSVFSLISAPLTGILSDRTRSRWGRRRPFTVIGLILGTVAIAVMASSPDVLTLGVGWILANLGWGTALGSIGNIQADRLAVSQRGKVGAFTGVVSQVAPVTGVLLVGPFAGDIGLAMWMPAFVGIPLVVAFVVFVRDDDSRRLRFEHRLTARRLFRSYGFHPREHPDFAWNWLGRFLFFAGITFTSTYGTFFFADRMQLPVQEIGGVVALMSGVGTAVSATGAIASGWISDRFGRRRPFILASVLLFATGAGVSAFAYSLPALILGGVLSSLGIAVFLAINQAMVLDVLPHRETQAGRFMGITAFSQKIPQAVAPLFAPLLLATGAAGASNFTALYLLAGMLVLAGGIVVVWRVRAVR